MSGRNRFATNENIGLIAANMPKLIPLGVGEGIKLSQIGKRLQDLVSFPIKSLSYLESIIITYREFLLGTIKKISKTDSNSAKLLLEKNLIPIITKHKGSSGLVTYISIKQYIEDQALRFKKEVLDSEDVIDKFFGEIE
ncbi:MAG: hypothetical protein ACFE91_13385 [Promethearchaeota archaeon]